MPGTHAVGSMYCGLIYCVPERAGDMWSSAAVVASDAPATATVVGGDLLVARVKRQVGAVHH